MLSDSAVCATVFDDGAEATYIGRTNVNIVLVHFCDVRDTGRYGHTFLC